MELVVDANVIVSALINSEGETARLLLFGEEKLYSPDFVLEELGEHAEEIARKARTTPAKVRQLAEVLLQRVELVPLESLSPYAGKARKISPDKDDDLYLALALKLQCPLWSNDRRLKAQREVEVLNTAEVILLLEKGATRRRH